MAGRKKKKQAPLIMGIVLLACVAMYGGLVLYNRSQEEQETAEQEEEPLFGLESDQIRQITYEYDGEKVAFVKTAASGADESESEEEAEAEESVWTVRDDPDFPLQTAYPADMAVNLSGLTYVRMLEADTANEELMAEYGLDSPSLTVSFADEEGTEYTVYFGSENTATGDYYGRVEGMEGIYTFASSDVTPFQRHLNEMVTAEDMPVITASDIESIQVEAGGESWTAEQKTEGDLELDPTDTLSWFAQLPDGSRTAVNDEAADSIASAVTGLSSAQCVAVDGAGQLEQYGLGDEAAVVTVHYTVETEVEKETEEGEEEDSSDEETETVIEHHTFVFRIGSQLEDGTYYMNIDGSSRVNAISQETAQALLNPDMESLLSLDQAQIAKNTVEGITAEGNGVTAAFRVEEVEEPADEASGETAESDESGEASESESEEETAIVYHYYRDGSEIEEEEFSEFYDRIAGFSADRAMTEEEAAQIIGEDGLVSSGSPELTLTYQRKNGLADVTVTFVPYNTDFYVMQVNGGYPLLVNKLNVSKIWDYLES